jgi:hypothetical protein
MTEPFVAAKPLGSGIPFKNPETSIPSPAGPIGTMGEEVEMKPPTAPQRAREPKPEPPAVEHGLFCGACRAKKQPDWTFCPHCGADKAFEALTYKGDIYVRLTKPPEQPAAARKRKRK